MCEEGLHLSSHVIADIKIQAEALHQVIDIAFWACGPPVSFFGGSLLSKCRFVISPHVAEGGVLKQCVRNYNLEHSRATRLGYTYGTRGVLQQL